MEIPRVTPTLNPEWAKAQCPYCRRTFSYVLNSYYQPKTCSSYECQRQYLHNVRPANVDHHETGQQEAK